MTKEEMGLIKADGSPSMNNVGLCNPQIKCQKASSITNKDVIFLQR